MTIESNPKLKVLLVENDDISIDLLSLYLKERYDFDLVTTGPEAVEITAKNNYDFILMDINLGRGMTGLQAVRKIREMEHHKKTLIVAVTAFAMHGDKEEFLEAGCTHYISKPFGRKQFLDFLIEVEKDIPVSS